MQLQWLQPCYDPWISLSHFFALKIFTEDLFTDLNEVLELATKTPVRFRTPLQKRCVEQLQRGMLVSMKDALRRVSSEAFVHLERLTMEMMSAALCKTNGSSLRISGSLVSGLRLYLGLSASVSRRARGSHRVLLPSLLASLSSQIPLEVKDLSAKTEVRVNELLEVSFSVWRSVLSGPGRVAATIPGARTAEGCRGGG